MFPKDQGVIAISVDTDQTIQPLEAVCSVSTLIAQAYVSKNVGK